ncbi:MAG: cell division protein FtsX [Bacillus sp. (in: firmicutes)]
MNLQLCKYVIRDGWDGLKRNMGAGLAASALISVAMILVGSLLFIRLSVTDGMAYLQSQIALKVYVDSTYETEKVTGILQKNSFIQSAEVETGQEMLQRLEFFFAGKEHLLQAFQNSKIEDSIKLELTNPAYMEVVVEELETTEGIAKVIYPQQFAQTIFEWTNTINSYGIFLSLFFLFIAFGIVYLSIHLSLYRRQKEITVKLLIGAKPSTVRSQFLFEGGCIGFVGSIVATIVVYGLYHLLLVPIEQRFPVVFSFSSQTVLYIMIGMVLLGSFIGVLASYVSTRKLIKDA